LGLTLVDGDSFFLALVLQHSKCLDAVGQLADYLDVVADGYDPGVGATLDGLEDGLDGHCEQERGQRVTLAHSLL
jgi:hypothetical protein